MKLLIGMAALGCAMALPVAAQDEVPALDVARCVVDNNMRNVATVLREAPGSPDARQAANEVLAYYGGCAGNTRASGELAWRERAELAHAAALAKLERGAAGLPAITWTPEAPRGIAGVDYDVAAVGMRYFGACVVRAAPQASLRLLRSEPGSKEEVAAAKELRPALAPCVKGGQKLSLNRGDLRFVVAEPIYQALALDGRR